MPKKLDNLDEMVKFLEIHNLPNLNQKVSKNLTRPITTNATEAVNKTLLTKVLGQMASQVNFTKHSKKN